MSITQNSEVEIPPVEEPEEFHPVALLWLAVGKFGWSDADFARAFGCELSTLKKWTCGQKVGRSSKISAATLKQKWRL
jgi:hypothetical protein